VKGRKAARNISNISGFQVTGASVPKGHHRPMGNHAVEEWDRLRNQAAELRRLARMTADQSDAFVHLLRAMELEAKADDLEAQGAPAAQSPTRKSEDDCNTQ
jgi:hypothetical protein